MAVAAGSIINSGVAAGSLTVNGLLTLGGGPAGSTASVNLGGGILYLAGGVSYAGGTNNAEPAVLGGNIWLNSTQTFTVSDSLAPDAQGASPDLNVSGVIAGRAARAWSSRAPIRPARPTCSSPRPIRSSAR